MATKNGIFSETPGEYAEAYKEMLKYRSLDDLNEANHTGLRLGLITLDHFMAAAEVLKNEILKR